MSGSQQAREERLADLHGREAAAVEARSNYSPGDRANSVGSVGAAGKPSPTATSAEGAVDTASPTATGAGGATERGRSA